MKSRTAEQHLLFPANEPIDYMPNPILNLIFAPIMGWLTLLALVVVGYLARLEYRERRKTQRLEAKRLQLRKSSPFAPRHPRPLAMRKMVEVLPLDSNCPVAGRTFQNLDRHTGWNLRPVDLN